MMKGSKDLCDCQSSQINVLIIYILLWKKDHAFYIGEINMCQW